MSKERGGGWLLLIHNIPPKPNYFRVKVWRKMGSLGAVAIKNSVYVLPKCDPCRESFQWIAREINQGGGDATICEALFVEGLTDSQIEAMFNSARNSDYEVLSEELRRIARKSISQSKKRETRRKELDSELAKLKRRFAEVVAIDYFGAPGREAVEGLLREVEAKLQAGEPGAAMIGKTTISKEDLQGRVWVTRRGVHVDRIASAWLIRRFIDSKAKFKFVDGKAYKPAARELRFDMFDAEFTHEGDLCTFEVLIARTHLEDSALREVAQMIHDIDLKDGKYGLEGTPGIEQLVSGICMAHQGDADRILRGSAMLDDLYEYFKRKRKGKGNAYD